MIVRCVVKHSGRLACSSRERLEARQERLHGAHSLPAAPLAAAGTARNCGGACVR